MREMEWPPARGGAELLIDRQRLNARRLGGLGQTLISGDLEAALADLALGAPMLGLYALAPETAHALRIGRLSALLDHARASFRCGRLARRLVCDQRRRRLGRGRGFGRQTRARRSCRRPPPTSPRVRRRPPFSSLACAACSRGRPPASVSTSRRRGWRRCSPGSRACDPRSCHSRRLRSSRSGIHHKGRRSLEKGGFPLARE